MFEDELNKQNGKIYSSNFRDTKKEIPRVFIEASPFFYIS